MSRLKPSERSKIKQTGELGKREGSISSSSSSSSNLSCLPSSLSSSTLSSLPLSSPITSSSSIADKIVCLAYPVEPVEKALASAYNNQQYDGNSNNLDALRGSE